MAIVDLNAGGAGPPVLFNDVTGQLVNDLGETATTGGVGQEIANNVVAAQVANIQAGLLDAGTPLNPVDPNTGKAVIQQLGLYGGAGAAKLNPAGQMVVTHVTIPPPAPPQASPPPVRTIPAGRVTIPAPIVTVKIPAAPQAQAKGFPWGWVLLGGGLAAGAVVVSRARRR